MHMLEQHDCFMTDCLKCGDYYFTKSVTNFTKYYLVTYFYCYYKDTLRLRKMASLKILVISSLTFENLGLKLIFKAEFWVKDTLN